MALYQEVLVTVPKNADPVTPQASELTQFNWNSDTHFDECVYQFYYEKQLLSFFRYPTTFLESKEKVNGVECEKWSNKDKSGPYTEYWAVWYAINAHLHTLWCYVRAEYNYPPSLPHTVKNGVYTRGCILHHTPIWCTTTLIKCTSTLKGALVYPTAHLLSVKNTPYREPHCPGLWDTPKGVRFATHF